MPIGVTPTVPTVPVVGQNPVDDKFSDGVFKPAEPAQQQNIPNNTTTATNPFMGKGSLITFNYSQFVHDPYPLVIVTDYSPGIRLRGLNLHYLTFPFIKNILKENCDKQDFSYAKIKGNKYITNAFRTYKWHGIRQIKKLDCNFLLSVMSTVRSFDPSESQAIRDSVREQLTQKMNPSTQDLQNNQNNIQGNTQLDNGPETSRRI